jgi:hypothetical protein
MYLFINVIITIPTRGYTCAPRRNVLTARRVRACWLHLQPHHVRVVNFQRAAAPANNTASTRSLKTRIALIYPLIIHANNVLNYNTLKTFLYIFENINFIHFYTHYFKVKTPSNTCGILFTILQ